MKPGDQARQVLIQLHKERVARIQFAMLMLRISIKMRAAPRDAFSESRRVT